MCKEWYSNFRGRNIVHLQHCERKRAEQVALEELRNRAQSPLPSPDYFAPRSTPSDAESESRSRSPSQEPLPRATGDTRQDQDLEDDFIEPPVPAAGGSNPGAFNNFSGRYLNCMCSLGNLHPTDYESSGSVHDPARDPTMWPLELGETLVIYHPHAERPPQVIATRELTDFSSRPEDLEDPLPLNDSRPPYFPFRTLADFEQTELFVKHDHTNPQIDDQLDLWRRHAPGVGVTLRNAREMHKFLEAAGIEDDLSHQ